MDSEQEPRKELVEGQVLHVHAEGVLEETDTPLDLDRGMELGSQDPEFIIVGIRRPGGVQLFVSSAVTNAKFARQVKGYDHIPISPGGPVAHVPRINVIVGVEMTSFEQVLADDYMAALYTITRSWERAGQRGPELPELPPGG